MIFMCIIKGREGCQQGIVNIFSLTVGKRTTLDFLLIHNQVITNLVPNEM